MATLIRSLVVLHPQDCFSIKTMEAIVAVKFSKALNQGQDILMIDSHLIFGYSMSGNGLYHVSGYKLKLVPRMRIS